MLVVYPLNQKDVQQKEDVLLRIFILFSSAFILHYLWNHVITALAKSSQLSNNYQISIFLFFDLFEI